MRTGDAVFHKPTGETWLVAYVDEVRGELVPCGWPMCFARISDCELRESATDSESEELLQHLAAMPGHEHDARRSWAQRVLRERAALDGRPEGG